MKKIILTLCVAFVAVSAFAQSSTYYVPSTTTSTTVTGGYYKPTTGTYVDSYIKTSSNGTNTDNFSTKGNNNPHTGQAGSRAADYSPAATNYGGGQTIQTGSRGGQYYINSNGNKTYVPKSRGGGK